MKRGRMMYVPGSIVETIESIMMNNNLPTKADAFETLIHSDNKKIKPKKVRYDLQPGELF